MRAHGARSTIVLFSLAILLLSSATTAQGITSNGVVDGNDHPFVGVSVAEWREEGVKDAFCSGTLISSTVYLTAAHCTAYLESLGIPNDEIWVTFDTAFTPSSHLLHGVWHTHLDFSFQHFADAHDLAVIILDAPVSGITPALLPEAGLLDRMKDDQTLKDQTFTIVGYGSTEKPQGAPEFTSDSVRKWATASFNSLNKSWLRLSQNQAHGDGGACYGDSGGPNFLGTTNIIAGTTTTGDTPCYSTNVAYRLDTESARAFLDDYVTVP